MNLSFVASSKKEVCNALVTFSGLYEVLGTSSCVRVPVSDGLGTGSDILVMTVVAVIKMCGTIPFLKEFLHFVELQQPLNTEDMFSVCWDWCISSFHTLQTQDWLLLFLQKCFAAANLA